MKLGLGRDPRGLVFARLDGQPIDADTLTKAFRRLVASAKVTPITFHGLRHTHISHLLMEGFHAKVVSERAGHAHVNVTLGSMQPIFQVCSSTWRSGGRLARSGIKGPLGGIGGKSVDNNGDTLNSLKLNSGPVAQQDRAAVS